MIHLGASLGQVMMCIFISPYCRDPECACSLNQENKFLEIYVKWNIEELDHGDIKRLYAKAMVGESKYSTEILDPYKDPETTKLTVYSD